MSKDDNAWAGYDGPDMDPPDTGVSPPPRRDLDGYLLLVAEQLGELWHEAGRKVTGPISQLLDELARQRFR